MLGMQVTPAVEVTAAPEPVTPAVQVPAAERVPAAEPVPPAVPVPAAASTTTIHENTKSYAVPVPAAGPSAPPLENPVTVFSPQFQAAYPVDLIITEKMLTLKEGSCTVSDVNGNVMFQIKGSIFSLHDRRTLVDGAGTPIASFLQKMFSAHRKWSVYRGESSDEKDLLFTVKKSSIFQLKTDLDVFLAGNTAQEVYDFKIKGSWGARSCTIYNANNTIIAQMHNKHDLKSIFLGRDAFAVTVYPHVDYAFITAIVVVLHEINRDRSGQD